MRLDDAKVQEYGRKGWIVLPAVLEPDELAVLEDAVAAVVAIDGPWIAREPDGQPHVVYGMHQREPRLGLLARHPCLLEPARQLLGGEVFVHQSRVNVKQMDGSLVPWHQDFGTYHRVDGIPEPRGIMMAVFLDEVNACNGPILAIPGSHREGLVSEARIDPGVRDAYGAGKFRYDITPETMRRLAARHGVEPIMGPPGSILLMDMTVVHGSSINITPLRRVVLYLNVSTVDNRGESFARPDFYAARDFAPLVPAARDCLLAFRRDAA